MVVIYASATASLNAPDTADADLLSRSEGWAALERICRDPVPHIDQITACRIVHESRDVVDGHLKGLTRMIKGEGSQGEIEEIAVLKRPVMIEFEFPKNGSFITSILAPGSGGGERAGKEMYLTQMYEWHCPEVREGSREHRERQAEFFQLARDIVGHTVEQVRKMKKDGLLGDG